MRSRSVLLLSLDFLFVVSASRRGVYRVQSLDAADTALQQRLDAKLAELRAAALLTGERGVSRFEQIFPVLLQQIKAGAKQPGADVDMAWLPQNGLKASNGTFNTQRPAHTQHPAQASTEYGASMHLHIVQSVCVFDDALFSLTPQGKRELVAQVLQPEMLASLQYIRRGGWWSCGTADMTVPVDCHCSGNVRLVDLDRNPVTDKLVDAAVVGGVVSCTSATFGMSPDTANTGLIRRGCECAQHSVADATSPDGFHLEKHLTSKNTLQEAWIMLTRLLGRSALLPTGTGDRTYHGIENWASRMPAGTMNNFPNHIFERHWVLKFIRQAAAHLPGPKCLEWGDPKNPGHLMHYVHYVPACTEPYDMQFDHTYYQGKQMHVAGNVVYSDILSLPTILGPYLKMNVIFATQVFEHVADPLRAAQALFQAIAPGGVLVFTAPQTAPFHKVPHDYYRYTVEGAKYLLTQAGFCVPNHVFAGGGDFIFSIAAEAGLQIQDFPVDEVDGAYQAGFDSVSHSAIGIHALAFKPSHPACDDPTAGWAWMQQQGMRA